MMNWEANELGLRLVVVNHIYIVVRNWVCVPSWDVISSAHHDLDLALKSPSIIAQEGLNCLILFRSLSKLDRNSSNSVIDWLGDWYMTTT